MANRLKKRILLTAYKDYSCILDIFLASPCNLRIQNT